MSELLDMDLADSLATVQAGLEKVFVPLPVPRVEQEILPFEALRLKDASALPCRKCMMKLKCQEHCKLYRMYIDGRGVYSKNGLQRNAAINEFTTQETRIYKYIIGEPI